MSTEAQTAFETYDARLVAAQLQSDPRVWDAITAVERDAWAHVAATFRRDAKVDRKSRVTKQRQAQIISLTAQLNSSKAEVTARTRGEKDQRSEKDRLLGDISAANTRVRTANQLARQETARARKAENELAQFSNPDRPAPVPGGAREVGTLTASVLASEETPA